MPDLTDSPVVADALRRHFGHEALRPGQARALSPVLDGRDALVVMPTGAGKSLVYQLAAVVDHEAGRGTTVVVSPLIALMKDQVDALRAEGIPAASVHSGMAQTEQKAALDALARGLLAMIYVAPERLRQRGFLRALSSTAVARLAVDEAHCVSQWGHDFRPDYRTIAPAREGMGSPPCVALTATATREVQADIIDSLRLGASRLGTEAGNPDVVVTGFDRPNLVFEVRATTGRQQKRRALAEILDAHESGAGLLYVSTRKDAEDLARFVRDTTGQPCEAYHAGLPDRERTFVQDRFIGGE
ncbi:MAG: RecQ family ATP-dependent DNA helicase, partial [Bacteroidota bacterium]